MQWLIQNFQDGESGRQALSLEQTPIIYRPQRRSEGYVFTGVCPQGGRCEWSGECMVRGVPGPGGLVSQHALRQTPLEGTATAVDGTHPTGMHSCLARYFAENYMKMNEIGPGRRGGGP